MHNTDVVGKICLFLTHWWNWSRPSHLFWSTVLKNMATSKGKDQAEGRKGIRSSPPFIHVDPHGIYPPTLWEAEVQTQSPLEICDPSCLSVRHRDVLKTTRHQLLGKAVPILLHPSASGCKHKFHCKLFSEKIRPHKKNRTGKKPTNQMPFQ